MGRSLSAGPGDFHVLAHDELEAAAQAGLDCGKIDLALALGGVAVADREQGARRVDWHVERSPGCDILVVDIPGVDARWRAANAAHRGQRRKTHGAEEGPCYRHH